MPLPTTLSYMYVIINQNERQIGECSLKRIIMIIFKTMISFTNKIQCPKYNCKTQFTLMTIGNKIMNSWNWDRYYKLELPEGTRCSTGKGFLHVFYMVGIKCFKLFKINLLKKNENIDADSKITMRLLLLVWSQILKIKKQNSCHSDIWFSTLCEQHKMSMHTNRSVCTINIPQADLTTLKRSAIMRS